MDNSDELIKQKNDILENINKTIEEREKIMNMKQDELPLEYRKLQNELSIRDKQIETLKTALAKKGDSEENEKYIEELKRKGIEKDMLINDLTEKLRLSKSSENEYKMMITDINVKREFLEYEINGLKDRLIESQNRCSELETINRKKELKTSVTIDFEYICEIKRKEEDKKELNIVKSDEENFLIFKKFEAELKYKQELMDDINYKLDDEIIKHKETQKMNKKLNKIISQLTNDKSDLEEIIIKQESKINDIANKVSIIDKMLKDKNKELKDNEINCIQLIKIIEEQKKIIGNIQNIEDKQKIKPSNIHSIAKFQNELKLKEVMIENLQIIIGNLKEENKVLKIKQIQNKYNKPMTHIEKKDHDDKSSNNFQELSQMMKKILEEN